jgi:histidinol-phosphate/aromatic aminotransferase/cobyric acid decarboxylase-like protein
MGSEHGGLNYSELRDLGISPEDVIDYSVSIKPDHLPEYYDACSLKTKNIYSIRMTPQESFRISVNRIIETVHSVKPVLLWLCSPNNPTGTYLIEEDFEMIRKACLQENTILILDEAYVCFVPDPRRYNPLREGVIVLRSMTKDFSIPGLRLGYLMASPDNINSLK